MTSVMQSALPAFSVTPCAGRALGRRPAIFCKMGCVYANVGIQCRQEIGKMFFIGIFGVQPKDETIKTVSGVTCPVCGAYDR